MVDSADASSTTPVVRLVMKGRARLTWQAFRRCRSKEYLPADRLCGGCRSLQ